MAKGRGWTLLLLGIGITVLVVAVALGFLVRANIFLYITVSVTIAALFVGGIPLPVHTGPDEPTPEQRADMQTRWFMNQVGRNITERQPRGSMRLLRPALLLGGPSIAGLLVAVVVWIALTS